MSARDRFATSQLIWNPVVLQYATYTILNLHKCDDGNRLCRNVGDILCPDGELLDYLCIITDSGILKKGEGADVI